MRTSCPYLGIDNGDLAVGLFTIGLRQKGRGLGVKLVNLGLVEVSLAEKFECFELKIEFGLLEVGL